MRVALFIPCFVDQFFPNVAIAMVAVLKRLKVDVYYPSEQTCCGQPGFNAGYWDEARLLAKRHCEIFAEADAIVSPSGSCTAMVRNFYRELLGGDNVPACVNRSYEFSEFLVKVLKVEDVGARFPHRVTYHDSCHLLRELGVSEAPRLLLRNVRDVELVEMNDYKLCCGFGGTFSVKFPEVSVPMGQDKIRAAQDTGADFLVAADGGCLMHLNGIIHRQSLPLKTMHLAELLAQK